LVNYLDLLPLLSVRFFFVALRPNVGHGLFILEISNHTQRRSILGRTLLDK
jgi:hypothetical protein